MSVITKNFSSYKFTEKTIILYYSNCRGMNREYHLQKHQINSIGFYRDFSIPLLILGTILFLYKLYLLGTVMVSYQIIKACMKYVSISCGPYVYKMYSYYPSTLQELNCWLNSEHFIPEQILVINSNV